VYTAVTLPSESTSRWNRTWQVSALLSAASRRATDSRTRITWWLRPGTALLRARAASHREPGKGLIPVGRDFAAWRLLRPASQRWLCDKSNSDWRLEAACTRTVATEPESQGNRPSAFLGPLPVAIIGGSMRVSCTEHGGYPLSPVGLMEEARTTGLPRA